jgi:hypothetical protein
MRSRIRGVGVVAVLPATALGFGCGETSFGTCADNGTCASDAGAVDGTTGADGGEPSEAATHPDAAPPGDDGAVAKVDGAGGEAGAGSCDVNGEPKLEPCVVDARYGVFVSPMGTSNGSGTKSSPLKSIDAALGVAVPGGGSTPKNVYVCAGTYAEAIGITSTRDKVRVFGGFRCSDWAYTGVLPVLAPPGPGIALTLTGLSSAVFADLEIDAQSAPSSQPSPAGVAGASSIAVFASGSSGVVMRRCTITAGQGQPGQDPTPAAEFSGPAPSGVSGRVTGGGDATPNVCSNGTGTSTGGAGGSPAAGGDNGIDGTPGASNKDTVAMCQSSTVGGVGAAGSGGGAGAGASSWAALSSTGWIPGSGQAGGNGAIGQGGGGGASVDATGGGGGGGAGGCGGAGGAAGTGGGSSIAVLAYGSTLDLEQCALSTANAGRGGNGAAGQVGQAAGSHGIEFGNACPGGPGGAGGSGGGGGGGAGGLSVGLVWSGSVVPTVDGSSVSDSPSLPAVKHVGSYGAAGQHGAGGAAVSSGANAGTDGTDGTAGSGTPPAVLQLP